MHVLGSEPISLQVLNLDAMLNWADRFPLSRFYQVQRPIPISQEKRLGYTIGQDTALLEKK
jgi:hypothetical protein